MVNDDRWGWKKSRLTRVAFESDSIEGGEDVLDLGAKKLSGSSKRVPVLPQNTLVLVDASFAFVVVNACGEGAFLQKVIDRPGDLNLTRVRSALVMYERVEGVFGS